jgi:hypothetical protein
MIASFKEMPPSLKFLTGMALFFVFLLMKSTIPGMFGTFSYNGEVLDFDDIWERGFGIPMILSGIIMPVAGMFLLLKSKYSRQFYCIVTAIVFSTPAIASGDYYTLGFYLIIPALVAVYLFMFDEVRKYYGN